MKKEWLGKKVYYANLAGKISEYTVVEKPGLTYQKNCDMLIEDERGIVYSANSRSYFLTKKEALENARDRQERTIKMYQRELSEETEVLNHILEQLKAIK